MCPADFKVRPEAGRVFEEVARFGAPPVVQDLFRRMSASEMLRLAEANAAKVIVMAFSFFTAQFLTDWWVRRA